MEMVTDQLWLECRPWVEANHAEAMKEDEPRYMPAVRLRQKTGTVRLPWENSLHSWKRLVKNMGAVQRVLMKNFLTRPEAMEDTGLVERASWYVEPHHAWRQKGSRVPRQMRLDHLLQSQRHYVKHCFKGCEDDMYGDWIYEKKGRRAKDQDSTRLEAVTERQTQGPTSSQGAENNASRSSGASGSSNFSANSSLDQTQVAIRRVEEQRQREREQMQVAIHRVMNTAWRQRYGLVATDAHRFPPLRDQFEFEVALQPIFGHVVRAVDDQDDGEDQGGSKLAQQSPRPSAD